MFDKIPIWFTWKNCCLFEYQNIKCIHLWLFTLCLKHIIFFKVGISQLSYPSTKIAYLPGCTRIFYSDVSIRVKNNLISITRQRGAIVHEEWWHPLSWFPWLEILCALVSAQHNQDVSGSITSWDCSHFKIIVLPVIQGTYPRLHLFTRKLFVICEERIKMAPFWGLSLAHWKAFSVCR